MSNPKPVAPAAEGVVKTREQKAEEELKQSREAGFDYYASRTIIEDPAIVAEPTKLSDIPEASRPNVLEHFQGEVIAPAPESQATVGSASTDAGTSKASTSAPSSVRSSDLTSHTSS